MSVGLETLIPHRVPMRFIDALTDCTDTTASATACFSANHFAVAGGAVLETALVECVAQTAAAAFYVGLLHINAVAKLRVSSRLILHA